MNKIISCCGVICSECEYYPIDCKSCPIIKGQVFWLEYTGEKICGIYDCCVNTKKIVTVQHPVKGTLIFGQNRENKISVSSLL